MKRSVIAAPKSPSVGFKLGVTGHRSANPSFTANRARIEATLDRVFDLIARATAIDSVQAVDGSRTTTRLHALMVDGLDQIAATRALALGWEIVAPLPFGVKLNVAINAQPQSADEAEFLLTGAATCSPETLSRAQDILDISAKAKVFALGDQDALISRLFLNSLRAPQDAFRAQAYSFAASERVALAARVMIEQSDVIIGVWDGASTSFVGGTGHTIALALSLGAPIIWIDARAPEDWTILDTPEALATATGTKIVDPNRETQLVQMVRNACTMKTTIHHKSAHLTATPKRQLNGVDVLEAENWRNKSQPFWHAYRRIEALFGAETWAHRLKNLTQIYETPVGILQGSASYQVDLVSKLTNMDDAFCDRIKDQVWGRFAWADGISARLSDKYRGGMVLNFLFSACAIIGGIAYLPFASSDQKWIFASFELAVLLGIVLITLLGQKQRWHGRWFETRRVAEYLRHAPILLSLGVMRPAGRWPSGAHTAWPEDYARHSWRSVGLPCLNVDQSYLRAALEGLLKPYVIEQRDYHRQKAKRLARVHHQLDRFSEAMFVLAVLSVSFYLGLKLAGTFHVLDKSLAASISKLLTFLGVVFPTLGGASASIRFFGDFERFSAISDVTSSKLDIIAGRIETLLSAPDHALDYGRVAELANAVDDVVNSEIENWQAVFGGKQITVPV